MVQIIPAAKRRQSNAENFGDAFGGALKSASQSYISHLEGKEKKGKMNELGKKFGYENLGDYPPEIQKEIVSKRLQGQNSIEEEDFKLKRQEALAKEFSDYFQNEPKQSEQQKNPLQDYLPQEKKPKGILKPEFEQPTERKTENKPQKSTKKIIPQDKIIQAAIKNPAAADKMQKWNDQIREDERHAEKLEFEKGKELTKSERYEEEKKLKIIEQLRQETLPIRKEIADRANVARAGIRNKEHLIDVIKKNDINDPTYAAVVEMLPFNLGKRMLSNDTVEYKSGLIDEFRDLASTFKGAAKVKEIEIYENKLADLYLDDDQKLAILKSRINAQKADIIRAEAAAKLESEGKFYGALQFQEEVNKIAQPQLDLLFNQILDEHDAVFRNAENRKKIPLDKNDPEDKKIMAQIKKEAGGDSTKALQLAKKKGYKFKGIE